MHALSRLGPFIVVMTVFQQMFFSVLAPLLPSLDNALHLSKAQAGLLAGAFSMGLGLMALPVGFFFASRLGADRIALYGLALLACTSLLFALADSYGSLLAVRFAQGAGAGLCWSGGLAWLIGATPRARRAEMIGRFSGAAAGGQLVGAVLGGVSIVVGRPMAFAVAAACTAMVAIIGMRLDEPRLSLQGRPSLALVRRVHRSPAVLERFWLVALPGLLSGTVFALGPLQLARLGLTSVSIGATFLFAAALGVIARPWIGRWADRHGLVASLRMVLLFSLLVTIAIPSVREAWVAAVGIVCAVTLYGALSGPAIAYLAQAYAEAGLAPVLGFALMGFNLGVGFSIGSAVAGMLAALAGDEAAYLLAAACSAATLVVLSQSREETIGGDRSGELALGRMAEKER